MSLKINNSAIKSRVTFHEGAKAESMLLLATEVDNTENNSQMLLSGLRYDDCLQGDIMAFYFKCLHVGKTKLTPMPLPDEPMQIALCYVDTLIHSDHLRINE